MKKNLVTYVLTGSIAVALLGAIPVFASTSDSNYSKTTFKNEAFFSKAGFGHKGGFYGGFDKDQELITEKAKELGIDTEGKETHALMNSLSDFPLKYNLIN